MTSFTFASSAYAHLNGVLVHTHTHVQAQGQAHRASIDVLVAMLWIAFFSNALPISAARVRNDHSIAYLRMTHCRGFYCHVVAFDPKRSSVHAYAYVHGVNYQLLARQ
jgi:hypothetical protein